MSSSTPLVPETSLSGIPMPPTSLQFTIKDSGERLEFETGSRRDVETDKLDYSLLPWEALDRDVAHYMNGLVKYGRHNWTKGQSLARAERSMLRHLVQYLRGERTEDHLAALRFNAALIMDHEARIARGELPKSLDDRDPATNLFGEQK
jgi:Domain of unknown function (DUF5664)